MRDHVTVEDLSAYLDSELDPKERTEVQRHLSGCSSCAAEMQRLELASEALGALPQLELTADEHRTLRQAVLSSRADRPSAAGWRRLVLAGGFALASLAVIGVITVRPWERPPAEQATEAAAPPDGVLELSSPAEVRRAVANLPEVAAIRDFAGATGGGEARTLQSQAREDSGGAGAAARSGDGAEGGDGQDGDGAPERAAPAAAPPERVEDECLTKVAREEGPGLTPLAARPARFEGEPASLLVFRLAPPDDPAASSRIRVWLIRPQDCAAYSGQALLDRVLYSDTFDRP
ncbi:MAG: zf-HC2 domain-containing protein [Actinomycetota bacterium]|nr:zf-HC2 domain-containing protein [Actinomycetota bacterium]